MPTEELRHEWLTDHDRHLAVGQMCYARWTSAEGQFRAYGLIKVVHRKNVLFELLERVYYDGNLLYRVGGLVYVPRYMTEDWNPNNCIEVSDALEPGSETL